MKTYRIWQFLLFLSFLLFSSAALAISPDAYEDDDSLNQAKLILVNESTGPQHHNFDNADDADWVKFYGVAGKTYLVSAINPGTDCDAALELYSSSGQKIQITTEPPTPFTVDAAPKGKKESFQWICPANGFYFLKVYFAVPQNFSGDNTNYDLSVEDRTAPNLGGTIGGLIQKASDHTTVIAGANVQISSSNDNAACITDEYGWYLSKLLEAGSYNLTVTANGYKPVSISVTVYNNGLTSNGSVFMEEEPPKTYYKDCDNDGYSDGTSITSTTRPPCYKLAAELTAISGDCNDADAAIHPGAAEICDGKDNNCNGQVDEGLPLYTYYRDADGDGYGDPKNPVQTCSTSPPQGYVSNNGDCNDNDSYNKALISGSIINKCSGQKISGVKITVSENGKTETTAANEVYSLSFVPNSSYTVTFEADGYEMSKFENLSVTPCQNVAVTNIELTPVVKVSGIIINKCSGQKISGVKITVSENGKVETVNTVDGNYSISFVPNIDYAVTFEADGYEKREFPQFKAGLCQNASEINMELSPIVSLYDVIALLKIMSGIDAEPPISFKNQRIEIFHAICILQKISGLRDQK